MNPKNFKFYVIILVFVCLSAVAAAGAIQAPEIEWERSYGGSGSDWPRAIQQTADGGYIVVGSSDSQDGDVTLNRGQSDFWVIKLNSDGDIVWQKSLGGSGIDIAFAVQQTTDSGYIVAGASWSSDGDVSQNRGGADAWVVKLDSNGEIEWQKIYGGSRDDMLLDIRQTTDGGFIFTGYTYSNDGDVSGNHGDADCWVVKLDPRGAIEWQRVLGGSRHDEGNGIRQTKDGGYIVAGSTTSTDGDVLKNNGGQDFWIIKLDVAGNIVWQKTYGGSRNEIGPFIEQTTDEGYIVAGRSFSNDGDVSGNRGSFDYWVIKLDVEGNLLWHPKSLIISTQLK